MLAAASELFNLIHHSRTAIDIRQPDGTLAFVATWPQFCALADAQAIAGLIKQKKSRTILRFVQLTVPVRAARQIAGLNRGARKDMPIPSAEDNKTSVREGRWYRHVAHRCSAYAAMLPAIDASCV